MLPGSFSLSYGHEPPSPPSITLPLVIPQLHRTAPLTLDVPSEGQTRVDDVMRKAMLAVPALQSFTEGDTELLGLETTLSAPVHLDDSTVGPFLLSVKRQSSAGQHEGAHLLMRVPSQEAREYHRQRVLEHEQRGQFVEQAVSTVDSLRHALADETRKTADLQELIALKNEELRQLKEILKHHLTRSLPPDMSTPPSLPSATQGGTGFPPLEACLSSSEEEVAASRVSRHIDRSRSADPDMDASLLERTAFAAASLATSGSPRKSGGGGGVREALVRRLEVEWEHNVADRCLVYPLYHSMLHRLLARMPSTTETLSAVAHKCDQIHETSQHTHRGHSRPLADQVHDLLAFMSRAGTQRHARDNGNGGYCAEFAGIQLLEEVCVGVEGFAERMEAAFVGAVEKERDRHGGEGVEEMKGLLQEEFAMTLESLNVHLHRKIFSCASPCFVALFHCSDALPQEHQEALDRLIERDRSVTFRLELLGTVADIRKFVDLKPALEQDESVWHGARQELTLLSLCWDPLDKAQSLVRCLNHLSASSAAHMGGESKMSAEVELDLLMVALWRERPSHLLINLAYTERFLPQRMLMGREGWALATFQTAVAWIEKANPNELPAKRSWSMAASHRGSSPRAQLHPSFLSQKDVIPCKEEEDTSSRHRHTPQRESPHVPEEHDHDQGEGERQQQQQPPHTQQENQETEEGKSPKALRTGTVYGQTSLGTVMPSPTSRAGRGGSLHFPAPAAEQPAEETEAPAEDEESAQQQQQEQEQEQQEGEGPVSAAEEETTAEAEGEQQGEGEGEAPPLLAAAGDAAGAAPAELPPVKVTPSSPPQSTEPQGEAASIAAADGHITWTITELPKKLRDVPRGQYIDSGPVSVDVPNDGWVTFSLHFFPNGFVAGRPGTWGVVLRQETAPTNRRMCVQLGVGDDKSHEMAQDTRTWRHTCECPPEKPTASVTVEARIAADAHQLSNLHIPPAPTHAPPHRRSTARSSLPGSDHRTSCRAQ